jgi:hypothetical protein
MLLVTGILALLAALLLMSCNPVKKVMKDPVKVEKVVAKWRLTHPLDTAKIIIKGRDTTIINEVVRVDSIRLPYPINHRYTEIRIKDRLVTDTVYLRDTAMIGVLIRKIEGLEVAISELKAENKSLKRFKVGVISIGVLSTIVLVVKKFKLL